MRGDTEQSDSFIYNLNLEERVPKNHPLRRIRYYANEALKEMSDFFDTLYSKEGRPSIPPEQLLRALLLQALYGIRSERLLAESIDLNLLYRWFVGLSLDAPIWHHSTFTKNRERLLNEEAAAQFLVKIIEKARKKGITSDKHFSVDGTLIEAWASIKSFQPKEDSNNNSDDSDKSGKNTPRNFHDEKLSNETHESCTDPDARLFKKSRGASAKLCYMGHALMENRNGLIIATRFTRATGKAEREAALDMIKKIPGSRRITLGADKGYDDEGFISELRANNVTPHIAKHGRRNNIDKRTSRHEGYEQSIRIRKRIEETFGWLKQSAGFRKTKLRGLEANAGIMNIFAAAYNLVRISRLCPV